MKAHRTLASLVAAACALLAGGSSGFAQPTTLGNPLEDCRNTPRAQADEKISACSRAIESGSLSPAELSTLLAERASAWLARQDPDKAITDLDACLALAPSDALCLDARGQAWHHKQQYQKAVPDYDQAIQLNPTEARFFYNRGVTLIKTGQVQQAIQDFDRAIELQPGYGNAYYNRATARSFQKDNDGAIADYGQAISLNANTPSALHNRGLVWARKLDFDKAIADYDEALRLRPHHARTYMTRGEAWFQKRDLKRAIESYETALKLDASLKLDLSLGTALFLAEQYEQSAKSLLAAQQSTQYPYASILLHLARVRGNDAARAGTELRVTRNGVQQRVWPWPVADFYLGQIDAQTLLTTAIEAAGRQELGQVCEAHFYIGELHLTQGRPDLAADHFKAAVLGCDRTFTEYTGAVFELDRLQAISR